MAYKFRQLGIGLACVLVSACAVNAPMPEGGSEVMSMPPSTGPTGAAQAAAPAKVTLAGVDVTALSKRIPDHPFAHYHVADNSYSFYIGNALFAEYRPDDNSLLLRPDPPEGKECVVSLNQQPEADKVSETCKRLVSALRDQLGDTAFAGN